MVQVTDRTLTERAVEGDIDAFSQLLTLNDDRMRALAYRMLGSHPAMEDALQAAYLNAFRGVGGFRGDADFGGWLRRIVINCCNDLHRQAGRRSEVSLELLAEQPAPDSSEERLIQSQQLHTALQSLPTDMRAAVILVDGEGLSYAEAADALGVERGTIASRLNRARAALRHQLGLSEETNR